MKNRKNYLILVIFSFISFVFSSNIYANNNVFLELKGLLVKIEELQNINYFFSKFSFIVNNYKIESICVIGEKMELKDSNAMTIYFDLRNIKNKEKMVLVAKLSFDNTEFFIEINNKKALLNDLGSKNRERTKDLYKKIINELLKKMKARIENVNSDVDKFFY